MDKQPDITLEIAMPVEERPRRVWWRRLLHFSIFDLHFYRNFSRLYENLYLLYALALRGVRARYKQSLLGVGWALAPPILLGVMCVYMYGRTGLDEKVFFPSPPLIYLLFTLTFWTFFSKAVTNGTTSLVSNMDLVTKVYFPREVLPISSVFMNLLDLSLSFVVWMLVAAGYTFLNPQVGGIPAFERSYPYYPHVGWLWLPVLVAALILFTLGVVFILSALQVYFRDVSHVINLLMLVWLGLSWVVVPRSAPSGGRMTMIIDFNPMAGIIDGLQRAVISREPVWGNHVIYAVAASVLLFLVGYAFLKHEERFFADVV